MSTPMLSFNLAKKYPGFNLTCEAEFTSSQVAIFGPSGSGKTTILNCIAGLTDPDSGEIQIAGKTVFSSKSNINKPPEKRSIGYVFQNLALFPHMNVQQNVLYGHKLTPKDRRRLDPEELVEIFGLGHLLERDVSTLSGGERQRVALARALATSPDLLILDEPLSSLDVAFRGSIIRYLRAIALDLNTPMLYVSHSISEVIALASEVLVVSNGQNIVQTTPSSALAQPMVETLTDYNDFENILDVVVDHPTANDGVAQVLLGKSPLYTPDIYAAKGDRTMVSIKATDIILSVNKPTNISAQNIIPANVKKFNPIGNHALVYVVVEGSDRDIVVDVTTRALSSLGLRKDQPVYLIIKTTGIRVLHDIDAISKTDYSPSER